jgi:protocatechuate 3,4-dioxygenase, beta subunit
MNPRRRIFNRSLLAASVASSAISPLWAQYTTGAAFSATPQDTEGPFYPKDWSGDVDSDLTTFNGRVFNKGTPLILAGRVHDLAGASIANAQVEIWQTDVTGKYRHPNDDGEGPAQRGFQGYGRTRTDSKGTYSFRTIKPVIYGGRPAHVHLRVIAAGHTTLTTQMYFAGENKEGNSLTTVFGGFSKERDRLAVTPVIEKTAGRDTLIAKFDIALARLR